MKVLQAGRANSRAGTGQRVVFTLDQCVLDKRPFHIRGRIPVPATKNMNLELLLRTQIVGRRPQFEIVDTSHPPAVEQPGLR